MEISTTMQASFPWLTLLVILPAVAAIVIALVPYLRRYGRLVALVVSLVELLLVIVVACGFDWSAADRYQHVDSYAWIPQIGVSWSLAVNGLALVMIVLAAALVPIVLVAAKGPLVVDDSQEGTYSVLVLLLEAFMVMIFAAFDMVVFYIAFEAMLVPLFFMIGSFGVGAAVARRAAAIKFLLFSLAGGLAMLGGLVAFWASALDKTQPVFRLDHALDVAAALPTSVKMWIFLSFMIAFAIKAPMVPVHTWLPDVAAASRAGTSVLLVGVLDKVGTFGMIVLCLRLFPEAANQTAMVWCILAVISILWGGLAAIGQKDLMCLVSYTSVSHFGFMVLGIFVGSSVAVTGAMIYMVAHGISIAALFLISGFLTQRGGTRQMSAYQGMQRVTPVIAGTWLFAGLASIALPGLSGFVPEFLVLMGTFKVSIPLALCAVLGVVLAALYILMPYQTIFTGSPSSTMKVKDMNGREKISITPLIIAMVILGIWAAPLVQSLTPIAQGSAAAITGVNQQTQNAGTTGERGGK